MRPTGASYFPNWMEFSITLGIVAVFALLFIFFVEHLRVFDHGADSQSPPIPAEASSVRDFAHRAWHGPAWYSLVAISTAAVAVLLLPDHILSGTTHRAEPVSPTRTVRGLMLAHADRDGQRFRVPIPSGVEGPDSRMEPVLLLVIDGNRNGNLVLFDHEAHRKREFDPDRPDEGCGVCHHMSLPLDRNTSCWECHRDMYEATSIFDHTAHTQALGGNDACIRCHRDPSAVKSAATAKPCVECHTEMIASDGFASSIALGDPGLWRAPGYMTAMHRACISCHERRVKENPEKYTAQFTRCDNCHNADYDSEIRHSGPYATFSNTERSQ